MEILKNYIDGEFLPPVSGNYLDNINPATGKVYSLIPASGAEDVDFAVAAAKRASGQWSSTPVKKRSEILLQVASLITKNLDKLALAESVDNGKPLELAKKVDIPRASANIHFFATAILHYASTAHNTDGLAINYTLRHPIGVAGCISPWNLPLYLFTWKIAPALAAGNCVVAKPSELTPYSAFLFSEICGQAGLPKGVLNIVHGLGASVGEAIVSHKDVPVISFTGGTVTGQRIASIAAPMFKKLSLELGGKNPNIIFADCDFEQAVQTTVRSSFTNQGQICLCGSRILVENSIYEKFVQEFVRKVEGLKVGDPQDQATDQGALVSQSHMEKIMRYIEIAKEEGGEVIAGGKRVFLEGRCKDGYFMEPTIITGLGNDCKANQEEIFGPVVSIIPFDCEGEAINIANATKYGLSATIWTQDLKRAHRVAAALHSGIVWVNCWMVRDLRTPFGGVKHSGVGREGGWEALEFFTEAKNVCVQL